MKKILLCLVCTIGIVSAITGAAQEDENQSGEQWYQIELLVFAYHNTNNINQEIWPQAPKLSYPQRIVALSSSQLTQILLNTRNETIEILRTVVDDDQNEESMETLTFSASDDIVQDTTIDPLSELTIPERQPQILVALDQQPFSLLDKQQLNFNSYLVRLARQKDIRPLFHGAWRQPIAERAEAESILIQGGDQFDNRYELEGSISLGLERYLHIKTDLWLSTFVSNAGRDKNLWATLPARPMTSGQQTSSPQIDPFNSAFKRPLPGFNHQIDNPFSELSDNQFSVERTVVLQQDRRMRSDELHYIDHPLMGVLVKITPYQHPLPTVTDQPALELNEGSSTE